MVDGPPKMVKISGKNLSNITEIYFGDITAEEYEQPTTGSGEDIENKLYYVPNFNDPRYSSIINYDDIISLEIKFLIIDGENKSQEVIADDTGPGTDLIPMGRGYTFVYDKDRFMLKEENLKKGFSKEFKIEFDITYRPFKNDILNKEYDNISYTYTSDADAREPHLDNFKEINKEALILYDYLRLQDILDINNNFIDLCNNTVQRKNDPDLDKLCKKKYDMLKDNITISPAPSTSLNSNIYTLDSGVTEADLPKLKILINGQEYEVQEGKNSLFFKLDNNNYNKNIDKELGGLYFQVIPNLTNIFQDDDDIQLKNIKITAINNETKVLIPSGIYLKPGLNIISTGKEGIKYDVKSWTIELKNKIKNKSKGGAQLVDSVNDFYQDTLNIITPPAETPPKKISYAVRDFAYKTNSETREYEFTWKPPTALEEEADLQKYFYYFTFEPTSDDVKDSFKYSIKLPILKEQAPTEKKSINKEYNNKITFSYDRLLPLNEYKYSFMVSTNSPQIRVLDDSQSEVIQFRPDGLEDYHTHLFDPVTGKFKLEKVDIDEIKIKQPELMQTYYQMVAYNQRVAEDEIRDSQLNMADSTKCLKGHTDQFMYGDMGSAFTQNLNKYLNSNNLKEGKEFDVNQEKQEAQISSIQKKLEELEKHHSKKVSLHDLQINTLKSLQDGSLIRIEEVAGEKKLIKLNDGCVAYNKNLQYGAKDDYGYVPCNLLDTEQHFVLNKINNLDEYNYLLSSNLKPRIDPNEDNKFQYPFYTLQPTDSVKCVNIEDGKFQIRPCEDSKSIKFQGFFNKDECNV